MGKRRAQWLIYAYFGKQLTRSLVHARNLVLFHSSAKWLVFHSLNLLVGAFSTICPKGDLECLIA